MYNRMIVGLGKGCVVVLLIAGFAASAVTWAALTVTADRRFDQGFKRKSTRTGTNASRARPSW
jgi:hypothetical protein